MSLMKEDAIIPLIEKAILNRTEATNIEFKDARGGLPGDLWRTVSSFSHTPNGGIIVFGIKEDREARKIEVVGNLDLAFLQEKIISYIRENIVNYAEYALHIVEYKNKTLLALVIQEADNERKPCYKKQLGLPNGACIRVGNSDRVITDEEMKVFIRNSAVFKFDKTQAKGATTDMLSIPRVEEFLTKSAIRVNRNSANNKATIENMLNVGIIDKYEEIISPSVGGFLIFSNNPPQEIAAFSRYIIRCVRYKGISVTTPIIDKLDISGTLDQQIDTMQKFILRNISLEAQISGTKRVERYEYPTEALRELVANAVIHRDYMITETYTQVNIFSNRIEISNPGNLPPGVTVENIKESQFSRNEVIATVLKDMDYLEEYGRGIDIVISKMNEWRLLEPVFKNTSNRFTVVLFGKQLNNLNSRQIDIWYKAQEAKKITAKECREMFPGVSRATIYNDISQLITANLLVLKGSSSNTYYEPIV